MRAFTISFFGLLLTFVASHLSFCDATSSAFCIESERQALLKFKQDLLDPSNKLSSWDEGDRDCCQWFGVVCNNLTGHVDSLYLAGPDDPDEYATAAEWDAYDQSYLGGKINPSLLHLKQLHLLDLRKNNFNGEIPEFIGLLKSLTYLNFSGAGLSGAIPQQLGNLSNLQHLDLGNNGLLEAKTLQWVSGLSSLRYLDLSRANLSKATDWVQVTTRLPSLVELHLSDCKLNNDSSSVATNVNYTSLVSIDLSMNSFSSIPTWIFSLPSLLSIDLGGNSLSSIPSQLSNLNKLQFLGLSYVGLQGNFPCVIGNLTYLTHLYLSSNHLESIAPKCLESFCNIREIDLSYNRIDHEVSEIIGNLTRCSLDRLESLNLAANKLSGHLKDQLGQFKNLAFLSIYENSISGPIPSSIGKLSQLKDLDVSENSISGPIPFSIGKLSLLKFLIVSKNSISGPIPFSIGKLSLLKVLGVSENSITGPIPSSIGNLSQLKVLGVSENSISGPIPSSIGKLSQLIVFDVSGNKISGPIPLSIGKLSLLKFFYVSNNQLNMSLPQSLGQLWNLSRLDISNAGILGVIPTWFWNLSTGFDYVNFSHNQLIGKISYLPKISIVDLSYNRFTGPLPRVASGLQFLSLSKNFFSGTLTNFLCNYSTKQISLEYLDIESNNLSGEIPNCWENLELLRFLYLGNNNLTGKIPPSMGSLRFIVSLNLRNNSLAGEISSTLQNLSQILILDLSKNQLTGSIPTWIGKNLSKLVVLNLRSNKFQSYVPDQTCALNCLQVLDLGYNTISGAIPKCFGNLSAMATKSLYQLVGREWGFNDGSNSIIIDATLVIKGRLDEYTTNLGLVVSLDLSANHLTGVIPEELGNLKELVSISLSGNLLTGNIPGTIGNMKWLESLDLSMNELHGEIPSSFSDLSFLSHLNLSYNNLIGPIPTSTQLQSFDMSSYIGNHLCGPPISKSCKSGVTPNVTNGVNIGGKKGFKVNWLYVSIVLGFVIGFWGVVAPLFFIKWWRIAYYRKLEHIGDKLYVFWATFGK